MFFLSNFHWHCHVSQLFKLYNPTHVKLGFPGSSEVKRLPAMWETWVRSLGQEDSLEKEMATHSSILAWRIPWTEEPGGLQSTGSRRVGHNWATSLSLKRKWKCQSLCCVWLFVTPWTEYTCSNFLTLFLLFLSYTHFVYVIQINCHLNLCFLIDFLSG